ncbi:MAG: hypothetical protein IJ514_06675 [Clostridia bacterium]|nr:hypothetical protein [Clostridia bacterium]
MRRGRVYRSIVICIVTTLVAVTLVPRAFYGAKTVNVRSSGNVTFIPDVENLISELEEVGLNLVAKEDGTNEFIAATSSDTTPDQWLNPTNAHNSLIEHGILSYEMYTYVPESCTQLTDLTIVLDFSSYAVTTFQAESIMTLRSAITGNLTTLRPSATVYNANGTTETASLRLRGQWGMTATMSSGTKNIDSYTLRLVFAGSFGDIEVNARSISFNPNNMDLPVAVEFDLRYFTAADRLVLADDATDYGNTTGTSHLHLLCNEESQLKYTVGSQAWDIKKYLFKDNIYKAI